jgi:uncharacterized alpha-E superfamily protein
MLSRVADNLYWMGRYVERAESVARLLDAALYLELDAAGLAREEDGAGPVEGVLALLGGRHAFEAEHPLADRDAVLRHLTFDRKNPRSIPYMIARARESARGTQESISAEVWSELNRLHLYLSSPKAQRRFAVSPPAFLATVKRECVTWSGLVDTTLARDEVYHFLQAGRYLERADQVGRILSSKSHHLREPEPGSTGSIRPLHWSSLLRSLSAYDAYLRTYHEKVYPEGVVRYLVLDADFPRALRFCVARCREALHEISGVDDDEYGSEAERLLGRLDGELRYIDVGEIFDRGLSRFLASVRETCGRIGDEIQKTYSSA